MSDNSSRLSQALIRQTYHVRLQQYSSQLVQGSAFFPEGSLSLMTDAADSCLSAYRILRVPGTPPLSQAWNTGDINRVKQAQNLLNSGQDNAWNKAALCVLSIRCCNSIVFAGGDFVTHCLPNKSQWAIMTASTLCVVFVPHAEKDTSRPPDAFRVWIPPEAQKLLDPGDGTDPRRLKMENCSLLSPTQASHSTFCLQHSTPLSLCLACRK